jgi:hypothetical protein
VRVGGGRAPPSPWEPLVGGMDEPPPPPTRTNGESALILRALCARKISALNEECTSGILPPLFLWGCLKLADAARSIAAWRQVGCIDY